ncbi:hypothetical protein TNIN_65201 [Trichonephila inaurata madagascariensis]|uniref:Uncharacterized protein n=1 Tax=Trichonephila inaurata madagascariensis TaxID=2747483 RepID=A0A8X6X7E4_9ARAC|nr:hypothetical protein TNIN_65201 [Trichonephila inaurata madagascariensis]
MLFSVLVAMETRAIVTPVQNEMSGSHFLGDRRKVFWGHTVASVGKGVYGIIFVFESTKHIALGPKSENLWIKFAGFI